MAVPYATWNDGTLRCSLSKTTDDAGASMLRFVQEHMVSIVTPINEHIADLYSRLEKANKALNATDAMVGKGSARLDRHEEEFAALDAKYGPAETELKALQKQLKDFDLFGRVTALENEGRMGKKARADLDNRMDRAASAMQDLRASLDERFEKVHRIELKAWQTATLAERLEADLTRLREEHCSVHERHMELNRGVQQIGNAHENTRQCVTKLSNQVSTTMKQVTSLVGSLEERMASVENKVALSEGMVPRHEEEIKSMRTAIEDINSHLGHIDEELHHLEEVNDQQDAAMTAAMTDEAEQRKRETTVNERLKVAEVVIAKMETTISREVETNIPRAVKDLTTAIERHSFSIGTHSTNIRSLEAGQLAHDERILNLQTRMSDSESTEEELVKRANLASDNLRDLDSSYKTAETRIDNHRVEIEKLEAYSSKTRKELGQTSSDVKSLYGDLGVTKGGLEETAMRLDLAHEYIHGMSKGLQETHKRSLAGQDGMLQPRPGFNKTRPLPSITTPGRPISAERGKASPLPRSPDAAAGLQTTPA